MPPVVVHIGYHKTATSWLQAAVFRNRKTGLSDLGDDKNHPMRRLFRDRPLDFDAAEVRDALEPLLRQADEAGLVPVVSIERLSGSPLSGGHDVKLIADRLKEVLPVARILIVVREQRAMILSTYKQYVRAGGTSSLERFLDPPSDKSEHVPHFDLQYFEYDRLIGYYRTAFGEDDVLTLAYEQFVEDPRTFVSKIAEFAGTALPAKVLDGLPYELMPNKSPTALTIGAMRMLNRFAPRRVVNPAPLVEADSVTRLLAWLRKNDAVARLAPQRLADGSEEKLRLTIAGVVGDRYVASNRRTAALAGVDLGAYGWMV